VIFRKRRLAAAILAPATIVAAALGVAAAASPVSAAPNYPPPSIHLLCTAANGGTLEGSVCALPFGVTTAPNSYTATIAVSRAGAAGATVAFAVTAGSLPPGLSLAPSSSGSGSAITGNPTKAGTFNFTIKATDGGLTSTLAYEITITVAGPPDQLLCAPADNGGFLVSGVCELPDAVIGLPYQGHLVTSHQAGGALSVVSGSLPPGLSLPATFTGSGDTIGGTATDPGVEPGRTFTVQGTGDQGQPLFQAYSILVDQNEPLAINPPSGGSALSPGMVGGAYAQGFFLSGGAGPYTWSLASGQLPPGLTLQTSGDPRDAGNELAGTATTAGAFAFTMRLTDYDGQQATQQFTLVIDPPLQISATPLATGTVGKPYSHDLLAQGGTSPYSWFVVTNINELPPGLTLGTTAPNFNNVLTGTPTKAGTFSFPMQVQDSQDNTANGTVTITINP
jgi:large repetitive protein